MVLALFFEETGPITRVGRGQILQELEDMARVSNVIPSETDFHRYKLRVDLICLVF